MMRSSIVVYDVCRVFTSVRIGAEGDLEEHASRNILICFTVSSTADMHTCVRSKISTYGLRLVRLRAAIGVTTPGRKYYFVHMWVARGYVEADITT